MKTSTVAPSPDGNRAVAPSAPFPASRKKGRKYLNDRKAPKANFLRKIKWSIRRRKCLFLFNIFHPIDLALFGLFLTVVPEHELPSTYIHTFLGWNWIYNTQGTGHFGSGYAFKVFYRAVWFVLELVLGAYMLSFRVQTIRDHHKDIGRCLPKDWKNLFLKAGRALLVGIVVLIYFLDVTALENPRIRHDVFYNACELSPVYVPGSAQPYEIQGTSWTHCGDGLMYGVDRAESIFRGQIPDRGRPGAPAFNGTKLIHMKPVGRQSVCSSNPLGKTALTHSTRPLRACALQSNYDFSNWITFSDTCDARIYTQWYTDALFTGLQFDYAEQWYCNVRASHNSTHLTVYYDTAFARVPIEDFCVLSGDPFMITSGPLVENSTVSGPVSNMTLTQMSLLTQRPSIYEEFNECETVETTCVDDWRSPPTFDPVTLRVTRHYYRSTSLYGCKRTFTGSPTVATDQDDWDDWLDTWKQGYRGAVAGNVLEVAWDILEALLYLIC